MRTSMNFDHSGLHPALRWAFPLATYAFAEAGLSARITGTAGSLPAGSEKTVAMELDLRDPETRMPFFGPGVLDGLVRNLSRALNFLADQGPGGHFRVAHGRESLRVEWLPAKKSPGNGGGLRTLVYTTAFGEEHFFLLAEQMFRSLRKRGYEGEAALLCDRRPGFAEELGITVLLLGSTGPAPLYKARLPALLDTSVYDRILFVDSDVVFLREPSTLFALANERLVISRDHCPLQRNAFNLSFFSPEGRRDPLLSSTRSINTGVMVFPGARCEEYLSRWTEAWNFPEVKRKLGLQALKHAELRDQPVMQKLVTEERLDCAFIPDNLLLMPLFFTENQSLHPDTVALHLNGSSRSPQQKQRLLAIMTELNALETREGFREVCDKLQAGRRKASFAPIGGHPASAGSRALPSKNDENPNPERIS